MTTARGERHRSPTHVAMRPPDVEVARLPEPSAWGRLGRPATPDVPRLLHIAPFSPIEPDSGGRVRIAETLKHLANSWSLRGLYLEQDEQRWSVAARPGELVLLRPVEGRSRRHSSVRWLDRALRVLQLVALHLGRGDTDAFGVCTPDFVRRVHEAAEEADVSLVELGQIAPCRPPGPAVLVAYDLNWAKLRLRAAARRAQTERGPGRLLEASRLDAEARRLERVEAGWYAAYDAVVVTSELDRDRLLAGWRRHSIAGVPVYVARNGVDTRAFDSIEAEGEPGTVAFVGGLDHPPNLDGLQLLVAEVLPLLGASFRKLVVAGSGTDAYTGPRIESLGRVDDVRSIYGRAVATVAPIRWGSGTRIKIIESLAAGRPVVAFPEAVDGLDDLAGSGAVLVVDDSSSFARAIEELVDNPERAAELGRRGRAAVTDYDWATTLAPVHDALRHALGRSPSAPRHVEDAPSC